MTDIGVVFLPNQECKDFALQMTRVAANELSSFVQVANNPHITAIHIANLGLMSEFYMHLEFFSLYHEIKTVCIELPIMDINSTGGNAEEGYKWLDLQFHTTPALADLRQKIVEKFCPLHNGTLTRMNDDMEKFNEVQLADIEKCGVTYSSYLPHITAWYIDLPNEPKTTKLQDIAVSLRNNVGDLHCYVEHIALVELGRNGNAVDILEQLPLCVEAVGVDSGLEL